MPEEGPSPSTQTTQAPPIRVFISYAAEDDAHRTSLEKYLKPLQREQIIETCHDRKILLGGRWGTEIDEQLELAHLVLCLVSADFLASNYCWDIELKRALEREAAGQARVIPILVAACDWESSPLGQLQALPERARPIATWPDPAEAWTAVAKALRAFAAERAKQPATASVSLGHEPNPARYLQALKDAHEYVEIRGMGAQVAERMPLRQVYTRLQVSGAAAVRRAAFKKGAKHASPDFPERMYGGATTRELRDVLAEHHDVALVGDPGSGKTTFLSFVAQVLARAHLGEDDALARIGLSGAAPFPVFVRLERIAKFLEVHPGDDECEDDAPKHFDRYLEFLIQGHPYGLPDDYLRERVATGGCFLLLDGLDEVPSKDQRERLMRLIEKVIVHGKAVGNRHLITCRARAYQGKTQLVGDIETLHLAPLGRAQVEQFCGNWSRALFRIADNESMNGAAREAEEYRHALVAAIDANPSSATLSASPLMLTVLAVVHWNQRKLPEQRVELYRHAVEYLLDSRKSQTSYPTPQRRECLQALALAMFEDPEGVQRSLGRGEAVKVIEPVLGTSRDQAIEYLENEELLSGLLVSRSEGEVEFWHLTFQEYLAALEISQAEEQWWELIEPHLTDDRWNEVVLLLAGCRRQGGLRAARLMIEKLLATGTDRVSTARAVALVGRILKDIAPYGNDASAGTQYQTLLAQTLAIFEPGGEPVEEAIRVEVGEALGAAGDPRLANEFDLRVRVPGGSFWMGAQSRDPAGRNYDPKARGDEAPVHRVTVSDLWASRFPVTVKEFGAFLDARDRGYLNPRNWSPRGWVWREGERRQEPGSWNDQLVHRNRPITEVFWYEADAYCRWVGGRLPTEAEWEWMARGESGRRFPWGDPEPTEIHATFDARIQATTPVGIYPEGGTKTGIADLGGNVWEWCADWYGEYTEAEQIAPTGPDEGEFRVLRGGAFAYGAEWLRAASRLNSRPAFDNRSVGFRVVWSAPEAQDAAEPDSAAGVSSPGVCLVVGSEHGPVQSAPEVLARSAKGLRHQQMAAAVLRAVTAAYQIHPRRQALFGWARRRTGWIDPITQ
jgi:formylglycine-generating enzyme required for sulfatase activity